jgi:hypothetical protein
VSEVILSFTHHYLLLLHSRLFPSERKTYLNLRHGCSTHMDTIFGNGSVNQGSTWQPEPTFRGTFSILSTCLITLGLCAWSAIHLNVASRHERPWPIICRSLAWRNARQAWPWRHWFWPGQLLRKIGWMFLAFFAPELVRMHLHSETFSFT